jgi:N-sulfoglucosamine sulfohydrolase
VRRGDRSYPCRAIRTRDSLYVRNLQPDLWPAGDPELYFAVGPFGDVDPSPTKDVILARRTEPAFARYFQLAFGKRPSEELYDLRQDPGQVVNVAGQDAFAGNVRDLGARLDRWMKETGDTRAANPRDDRWDRFTYYGPRAKVR